MFLQLNLESDTIRWGVRSLTLLHSDCYYPKVYLDFTCLAVPVV